MSMNKDNFNFMIGGHLVDMTNGVLTIDGAELEIIEGEGESVEYAMARRIAYEEGIFTSDEGVEVVTWQVP